MAMDKRTLKAKEKHDDRPSKLFGLFKPKESEEVKTVTVREEKRKIKRIVKPGPKAIKHASEAFKAPVVTEEQIKITEQVMEGVAPVAQAHTPKMEETFTCVQCGAQVPKTSERCPKCHALYIKDIPDEDFGIDESSLQDDQLTDDAESFLNKDGVPCIHFDAETGTISYLESDEREPDFMLECSHCGTAVQFSTDRCPICGTRLDVVDTGIVSLFSDMKFDDEREDDLDCPLCGEHVTLVNGRCTACGEVVLGGDMNDSTDKVDPVIRTDNVVFLHLDVKTGELNYLQRLAKKLGFEQLTVHLDDIGRSGFDEDWKSLSRI